MKKSIAVLSFIGIISINHQAQPIGPFNFKVVKNLEATEVKNQENTGTCWSYSASSFLESEILRKSGKKVDLSEMFSVRKIYLEKATLYLRYHGKANFSQGALAHDELYAVKTYGLMPEEAYDGKPDGKPYNHDKLEQDLKTYLDSLLSKNIIEPQWKERFEVLLDNYLGVCPALFVYEGTNYNSKSFAASLGIKVEDYVGFTSYTHHPYYKPFCLEVPDNFSRGQYTNIPMDQMMELISASITKGYTVEWDGDVSESGFIKKYGAAVLLKKGETIGNVPPIEDVPTQELRQVTFDSHETTDDHLMHITGIATDQNGKRYFITKNSWGKATGIAGYVYMSENYVKLKTVSIYVHKDVIPAAIKNNL